MRTSLCKVGKACCKTFKGNTNRHISWKKSSVYVIIIPWLCLVNKTNISVLSSQPLFTCQFIPRANSYADIIRLRHILGKYIQLSLAQGFFNTKERVRENPVECTILILVPTSQKTWIKRWLPHQKVCLFLESKVSLGVKVMALNFFPVSYKTITTVHKMYDNKWRLQFNEERLSTRLSYRFTYITVFRLQMSHLGIWKLLS